jgi:hypothetical protein
MQSTKRGARLSALVFAAVAVASTAIGVADVARSDGKGLVDCVPGPIAVDGEHLVQGGYVLVRDLPAVVHARKVPYSGCGLGAEVFGLAGVPETVAVSASRSPRPRTLFVAGDSFPQIEDHPLHRYLYRRPTEPNTTHGRACSAEVVRGRVSYAAATRGIAITANGRSVRVQLEAGSRLIGPLVDGIPRLRVGHNITAHVLRCRGRSIRVARIVRAT